MTDITPGTYRNTNTGAEFTVELDNETEEVIMHCGHGASAFEIRKDQGDFWFNTLDATGPTYELTEPAPEINEAVEDDAETDAAEQTDSEDTATA